MSRIVVKEAALSKKGALPTVEEIRPNTGSNPPLFYLNGQPAGGGKYARRFVEHLPEGQGLYIVAVPIMTGPVAVEIIAKKMLDVIKAHQPSGPYIIGGNCFGATLAFEIAQCLRAGGEQVSKLILIHPDAHVPMHPGYRAIRRVGLLGGLEEKFSDAEFSSPGDYIVRTMGEVWRHQRQSTPKERRDQLLGVGGWAIGFLRKHATKLVTSLTLTSRKREVESEWPSNESTQAESLISTESPAGDKVEDEIDAHARYMWDSWKAYKLKRYDGPVTIIWPVEGPANPPWKPTTFWKRLTPNLDWISIPGSHWTMLHKHFEHAGRAVASAVESRGTSN